MTSELLAQIFQNIAKKTDFENTVLL